MREIRYQCSAETQKKLINAVIGIARKKSYEGITVQEICRTAGVSTGSFYHQFGSKDELVKQAYRTIDWLLTEEFTAQYQDLPPVQALDTLLRRYILFVRDEIGLVLAQYYTVLLKDPAEGRYDAQRPYCREIRRILTRAMEQHVILDRDNPEQLTFVILRLIRGLLFDWVIQGGSFDLLARYELDFRIFLRGLAVQQDGAE